MHVAGPSAVVPAAGKSSRFGSQKLLADVDGQPLIRRTVAALSAGGVHDIIVVVGPQAARELQDVLTTLPVRTVVNPEPDRGMFSSVQAGLRHAGGHPVLVLPADMPFVEAGTVRRVVALCLQESGVVVPTRAGRRGHPVGIPHDLVQLVVGARPEGTLKDALVAAARNVTELPVDDDGVLRDVDVPEDIGH